LLNLTLDTLLEHREKTYQGNPDGFVFCSRDGSPLNGDSVTKSFQRSLRTLGLRRIRFHDLRHTHATYLLNKAIPVKVVQEILGHKSAKTTLDIYGHVMPGLQDHLIEQMENIDGLQAKTGDMSEPPPEASGRIRTDDRRFTKPTADVLVIQLVDAIIALGDVARQLKLALSNNGYRDHKPEETR